MFNVIPQYGEAFYCRNCKHVNPIYNIQQSDQICLINHHTRYSCHFIVIYNTEEERDKQQCHDRPLINQ